jgi:hypothetical protein
LKERETINKYLHEGNKIDKSDNFSLGAKEDAV